MTKLQTKPNKNLIITIEEKLFITPFRPSTESHIKTNQDICNPCPGKECTKFCPANVFVWSAIDEKLIIGYENCLECGACKMGCPFEAIEYTNPKSGYGVL